MNEDRAAEVRVALIQSSWHKDLVDRIATGFIAEAGELGHPESSIEIVNVTGAFEIPLHAKRLAESGRYDAIVAAGLVVDGGIYRHEFVADAVISGLMRVQLDTGVPILSVVLTPHEFHEHEVHRAFFFDHLLTKGNEAAQACYHTVDSLRRTSA
ncbi:MAG: 6,7-dimethyl-8-ribityllumazine synthase [Solirubrobacterales bacterium]|nr:6,7-dimethyl-8-ribityllumazine synthase [Solirubrobacterales bacterium]MCB0861077.1 6,7-dimethyl-8-ribityllumazine synthase [Solirubrobacterales bacterium]